MITTTGSPHRNSGSAIAVAVVVASVITSAIIIASVSASVINSSAAFRRKHATVRAVDTTTSGAIHEHEVIRFVLARREL